MTATGADVVLARQGPVVVARIVGEVDLANAAAVGAELAGKVAEAATVAVDLSDVGYLDSAGLRALDELIGTCRARAADVRVVAPPDTAAGSALRLSGFPDELLAGTVADAVAALAGP